MTRKNLINIEEKFGGKTNEKNNKYLANGYFSYVSFMHKERQN